MFNLRILRYRRCPKRQNLRLKCVVWLPLPPRTTVILLEFASGRSRRRRVRARVLAGFRRPKTNGTRVLLLVRAVLTNSIRLGRSGAEDPYQGSLRRTLATERIHSVVTTTAAAPRPSSAHHDDPAQIRAPTSRIGPHATLFPKELEEAIFRRAPRPQIRANERARADDSSRTFAS